MNANTTITYLTEPIEDYTALVNACKTIQELRTVLADWKLLANDARLIAEAMTKKDWPIFQKGLKSERRGRYAGDDWAARFAPILMPAVMFHVALTAARFCCPWGLAYSRHKEAGHIIEENGIATWHRENEKE